MKLRTLFASIAALFSATTVASATISRTFAKGVPRLMGCASTVKPSPPCMWAEVVVPWVAVRVAKGVLDERRRVVAGDLRLLIQVLQRTLLPTVHGSTPGRS